jgi:GT2 family glycosyltransferase
VNETPGISVIIVNLNGAKYLSECLDALYGQRVPPQEVLIIDNASSDNSLEIIETFRAQHAAPTQQTAKVLPAQPILRVMRNPRNVGFGAANNQGIRASSGKYVLLLNADVVLERDFLKHTLDVMRRDKTVGLVAGKLLNYEDRRRIDSTGLLIRKNRRAYDRGQGECDTGLYEQEEEVFGVSGAACLCRRAVLEDIRYADEYFDELFFAYKGDVDLSWRVRLFGWKCVYTPQAIGWHYRKWGIGKRRDIPRLVRRHSLKNRYLMLLKNEHWRTLLPGVLHLIVFEIVSLGYIVLREPHLFLAFADIVRMLPLVMKKRRHIQRIARQRQQILPIGKWFM